MSSILGQGFHSLRLERVISCDLLESLPSTMSLTQITRSGAITSILPSATDRHLRARYEAPAVNGRLLSGNRCGSLTLTYSSVCEEEESGNPDCFFGV